MSRFGHGGIWHDYVKNINRALNYVRHIVTDYATVIQPHLVSITKALIHLIDRIHEIIQPVFLELNTSFKESAVADPEGSQRIPPSRVPKKRPYFGHNIVWNSSFEASDFVYHTECRLFIWMVIRRVKGTVKTLSKKKRRILSLDHC